MAVSPTIAGTGYRKSALIGWSSSCLLSPARRIDTGGRITRTNQLRSETPFGSLACVRQTRSVPRRNVCFPTPPV